MNESNDRILHLWGPAAVDVFDGSGTGTRAPGGHDRPAQSMPDLVIVPSYWGTRRMETVADGMGPGTGVITLSEALLRLEEPARPVSVLVEVEKGDRQRVCVSQLDFVEQAVFEASLVSLDGFVRASDRVLRYVDEAGIPADDVEFIVAADPADQTIAELWRRGLLAYPVPTPLLGQEWETFQGPEPGSGPGAVSDARDDDLLDIDGIRARMTKTSGSRKPNFLTVGAAASVAAAVGAVAWLGFSRVEFVDAEEPEHETSTSDATSSPIPMHTEPEMMERVGDGFVVTMPMDWEIVPDAVPGMLVLHDGGRMRVLATTAEQRVQGLDLEAVEGGLAELALDNPEIGQIRREQHDGDGYVVHEERPGDDSVVVWHHRVQSDRQLSVGCQYRGQDLPQVRPLCTGAVTSMRLR